MQSNISQGQGAKALPPQEIEIDVNMELSELLPIAGHFDIFTLLGKNGELIRVIELETAAHNPGKAAESNPAADVRSGNVSVGGGATAVVGKAKVAGGSQDDMRGFLRAALLEVLPANCDITVQLYTVRDYADISLKKHDFSGYQEDIAEKLSQIYSNWQEIWNKKHEWSKRLRNKLYIALVHRGLLNSLRWVDMLKMPLFWWQEKHANTQLHRDSEALARVADNLCHKLSSLPLLRCRKLGMKKQKGVIISELLTFYNYLLNFQHKPVELGEKDASRLLTAGTDLDYFFNEAHLVKNQEKSYMVNFCLKASYDLPALLLDKLINASFPCVFSESIIFEQGEAVPNYWRKYQDIYQKSRWQPQGFPREAGGANAGMISGVAGQGVGVGSKLPHCWHQVSFTVFANNYDRFIAHISQCVDAMREVGVQFSREDFYMPAGLLALLPGNNRFLSRLMPIFSSKIAGYAKIMAENSGNCSLNLWGEPLMLLPNADKVGFYYLNPHYFDKVGHIMICDSDLSKIRTISGILLLNSLKYSVNILTLDLTAVSIASAGNAETAALGEYESSIIEINKVNNDLSRKLLEYTEIIDQITLKDLKNLHEYYSRSRDEGGGEEEQEADNKLNAAKELLDLAEKKPLETGEEGGENEGGEDLALSAAAKPEKGKLTDSEDGAEAAAAIEHDGASKSGVAMMAHQVDIAAIRAGTTRAVAEHWGKFDRQSGDDSSGGAEERDEELSGGNGPAAGEANTQLKSEDEVDIITADGGESLNSDATKEAEKLRRWLHEQLAQYYDEQSTFDGGAEFGKEESLSAKTKANSGKAKGRAKKNNSNATPDLQTEAQASMAKQLEELLLGDEAAMGTITLNLRPNMPELAAQVISLSFLNNLQKILKNKPRNVLIIRGGQVLLTAMQNRYLKDLFSKFMAECTHNNISIIIEYLHNNAEKFTNNHDRSLLNLFNTQIILSNRQANASYRHIFNFTDADIYRLKMLSNRPYACMISEPGNKAKVAVDFSSLPLTPRPGKAS